VVHRMKTIHHVPALLPSQRAAAEFARRFGAVRRENASAEQIKREDNPFSRSKMVSPTTWQRLDLDFYHRPAANVKRANLSTCEPSTRIRVVRPADSDSRNSDGMPLVALSGDEGVYLGRDRISPAPSMAPIFSRRANKAAIPRAETEVCSNRDGQYRQDRENGPFFVRRGGSDSRHVVAPRVGSGSCTSISRFLEILLRFASCFLCFLVVFRISCFGFRVWPRRRVLTGMGRIGRMN
jgi:hypothetical protein